MNTRIKLPMHTQTKVRDKMNPFFPVEVMSYLRSDGVDDGLRCIVNMENGKTLGEISKGYNLTTHKQASGTVKDFLDQIGVKYESAGGMVGTAGARYFETISFPGYAFNPATSTGVASTAIDLSNMGAHDKLKEETMVPYIVAKNSYDKTAAVSWSYGLARLWCSNGMGIITSEDRLSYKHNQAINVDHVKDTLLSHLDKNIKLIERVYARLNNETGTDYLSTLINGDFPDKFKLAVIEKIAPYAQIVMEEKTIDGEKRKVLEIKSINTDQTGWAVYNVATDVASHVLTARNDQEVVGKKIAKAFAVR